MHVLLKGLSGAKASYFHCALQIENLSPQNIPGQNLSLVQKQQARQLIHSYETWQDNSEMLIIIPDLQGKSSL